jgi:crotonobetainyl-CoA:carnitine CoA-transferase CaiB-like acyl-CoA transferase
VFSNLRGDQPERLGLTYDHLKAVNPRIVCVALTGFGRRGADALLPGYDALVQAQAGWASLTGGPDDPPTKSGLSLADYICGLTAMIGLLAALRDAEATGVGRDVDTNLYDSSLAMLSYPATWYSRRIRDAPPPDVRAVRGAVPVFPPDGHASRRPKKFYTSLVHAMGLPNWPPMALRLLRGARPSR